MFASLNLAQLNKDQILLDYSDTIERCLVLSGACAGAKKHLQRGLLVRINMMEVSIDQFSRELQSADGPLSVDLARKLTLLINALYLNLAGSLDNLAWAIMYQHALYDSVNEDCPRQRKSAQLVGEDFLKRLSNKGLSELESSLRAQKEWYRDMKKFRDPAAHRIPLIVPPSIYSEDDADEAMRLDALAAELYAKGDHCEGRSTWRKINELGEWAPLFACETSCIKMYDVAGRINLDHSKWQALVAAALSHGFE
jgi:hypothetical protein